VTGVTHSSAAHRRTRPAVLGLAATLSVPVLLALTTGLPTPANAAGTARHEVYPVPPGGVYTIHGRGNGHGHGMSQWGAYGAVKVDHLSMNQVLHFYYPHTTLATKSTQRTIRVLLSATDASGRGYVQVKPALGLSVTPSGGKTLVLARKTAKKKAIAGWRLQKQGSSVLLRESVSGTWHTVKTFGSGATISDTAEQIPVVTPSGPISYRGSVVAEIESGAMEAVNDVNVEQYLYSVVPAEMSSSWPTAALQAQAVASRSYARHGLNNPKASWYDVDGDTRDQAYGGVGIETARTTNAVNATAGETIVDGHNRAIMAQYASADGGWTVSGGVSYLPSEADPYDGAIPNTDHAWTRSVAASTLEAAYPKLGKLEDIDITGRDGDGLWGGRVTELTLVGSHSSVQLSGSALQATLGFGSTWFRPTPLPAAPAQLSAKAKGSTVTITWQAPHSVSGASPVSGYLVTLAPGKHSAKVSAKVLTESVAKLAAGTYTVRVAALSKAGTGPTASTTVTVGK